MGIEHIVNVLIERGYELPSLSCQCSVRQPACLARNFGV